MSTVANLLRQYVSDMESRYELLFQSLKNDVGSSATDIIIKEVNHHKYDFERMLAERIEKHHDLGND